MNVGETCDDGARVNGDGCSRLCQREAGFMCGATFPTTCAAICGDGMVVGPEVCDDGNTVGGDACEADCRSSLCNGTDTEPNGTRALASCIALGATAAGTISPTGDQDFWRFFLAVNSDVRIETFDGTGTMMCAAPTDTVIDLYNAPTGASIYADDNDGINNCSLIDGAVAADVSVANLPAGMYFVRVRNFSVDATGPYGLRLTATPGPVCGDSVVGRGEECDDGGTALGDGCDATCRVETVMESEPNEDGSPSVGATGITGNDFSIVNADGPFTATTRIRGSLSPAGDEDVFAVTNTGATARTIVFRISTGTGGTCPTGDTGLNIRDAAGLVLASNDDFTGLCSQVTYSVPAGATVYAHVVEYFDDAAIANYFLDITYM